MSHWQGGNYSNVDENGQKRSSYWLPPPSGPAMQSSRHAGYGSGDLSQYSLSRPMVHHSTQPMQTSPIPQYPHRSVVAGSEGISNNPNQQEVQTERTRLPPIRLAQSTQEGSSDRERRKKKRAERKAEGRCEYDCDRPLDTSLNTRICPYHLEKERQKRRAHDIRRERQHSFHPHGNHDASSYASASTHPQSSQQPALPSTQSGQYGPSPYDMAYGQYSTSGSQNSGVGGSSSYGGYYH